MPDKPGKLAQCTPVYGTILGQRTRNRANAGPIFLVCRDVSLDDIEGIAEYVMEIIIAAVNVSISRISGNTRRPPAP